MMQPKVYSPSTEVRSGPLLSGTPNNRRFRANGVPISPSGSRTQHQYQSPKRTPLLDYELQSGIEMNKYVAISGFAQERGIPKSKSPITHIDEQVSNLTSQSGSSGDKESSVTTSETSAESEETSYVSGRRPRRMKFRSDSGEAAFWAEERSFFRQRVAWFGITISAIQLAILLIQIFVCGLASIDVNPMVGPFPDAFSEWGGKNAYLMIDQKQYYRIITPVFLNVGVVQLLVNVFCQLETCAYFEREWGSDIWLVIYLVSGMGAVASSCVESPDTIGVCSSGAVMGLFGAKIAQAITYAIFDLEHHADGVQLDQLGGVLCSTAIVSAVSCVTYIDLSSHIGGLLVGFLLGILIFSQPIASMCARFFWACVGLGGLSAFASGLFYFLWLETSPDEDLGDACQYFRNLYPEDYDCDCSWG